MQFTIASIVTLTLATSTLANLLVEHQNGVTCQTSSASPATGDVIDVINQLKGLGGECPQTNGHASDCSTLVEHNSAAISICGGESPTYTCDQIADYANQIQQTCMSGGKVGGTFTISASRRVEVINVSSV